MKPVKFKIPERLLEKDWLGPKMLVSWDAQNLLHQHNVKFCKKRKVMFFKSFEEGVEFTLRHL
jgi:hypothetical protein